MRLTLDQSNPDYFALVKERTEKRTVLDCFKQARRILGRHTPIGTCLDVGCASGYLYFHLRDLLVKYHGVDASQKFIKYGRKYFAGQGIEDVELHHKWFEFFVPPCSFDALISMGLFYIFPNYHQPLDAMMRMTRKVIVLRSLFADETCYRYLPEMPGSSIWTYYNIYSTFEIEAFVESRGWLAVWHEDDYVNSIGGYYETAGVSFPFKFLELVPKG